MNIDEIKKHLQDHMLYVVERSTSRRGIPSIASFYIVVDGQPTRIDAELVKVIGEGTKLIKVGRVLAASIHDPYLHALEDHMEDLSEALFENRHMLKWRVI